MLNPSIAPFEMKILDPADTLLKDRLKLYIEKKIDFFQKTR